MVEAAAAKVNEKKKEILRARKGGLMVGFWGVSWAVGFGARTQEVGRAGARGAVRSVPVVAGIGVVSGRVVEAGESVVSHSRADEGVAAGRNAKAEEVPHNGSDAGVEGILEEHVAHVLVANGAGLEGREAALHQEDQAAREENVEGVRLLLGHAECVRRAEGRRGVLWHGGGGVRR